MDGAEIPKLELLAQFQKQFGYYNQVDLCKQNIVTIYKQIDNVTSHVYDK